MRQRFLQTGPRGLSLCLCEWGPESGRPLVILHGFLEQGAAWQTVAEQLGRRVIAPDHRGHGRSEHVGAGGFYHFWDYIPDVDAIVDDVSNGEPVDLVGHSMGGTMACLYAATRPEKVRRLGLIEGLGPVDMADQAVTRPRRFAAALQNLPTHTPMESVAYAASRIRRFTPSMSEATSLRLAERVTTPHDDGCIWSWDALHRSPNPLPFSAERFAQSTQAIECEVLHIDGSDSIFRPPDLAQRMTKVTHLTCDTLPGGHMLHHDVPGALAERLMRFFE